MRRVDDIDSSATHCPRGDLLGAAAFEQQVRPLTQALTDQALRLLGDRGRSEDIVQEALLQMWRHRERFDPLRGSIAAWAHAIVRHLAIDQIRHDQAVARREELFAARASMVAYDEVVDAVERVLEYERVRFLMEGLSELQQQAIELVYFDRISAGHAAEHLGIPASTLRTRLRDARSALERILRND